MQRLALAMLAIGIAGTHLPANAVENLESRRERQNKEKAQAQKDLNKKCFESYNNNKDDDAIAACSGLIDAKAYEGAELGNVYFTRASAHMRKGECDKAVPDLLQAQTLQGETAQNHWAQFFCAQKAGDKATALAAIDKAVAMAPDNVDYVRSRCVFKFNSKDYAGAVTDCEAVTLKKPDDADIWLAFAAASEVTKQFDKARIGYTKVLSLKPDNQGAADGLKRVNQAK